jgi:hypothetical protein
MEIDGKCDRKKINKVYQLIKKTLRSIAWSESWHALFVAVSYSVSKETHKASKI